MGPNGSGKSTLAQVLAGHPAYEVTGGTATYDDQDLLAMDSRRAGAEGTVSRLSVSGRDSGRDERVLSARCVQCDPKIERARRGGSARLSAARRGAMRLVDMDAAMLHRAVNAGFSGGEKKRNEILQMAVLEPRLACSMRPTPDSTSMPCGSSPAG